VLPVEPEIVLHVRAALVSPQYGHPAYVEQAKGYGPCRSCLQTFEVGQEERILFTYNPFDGLDPYPSPGPIFVHRQTCAPFVESGFPEGLRPLPLTFEAYGADRWIVDRMRVQGSGIEAAIEQLLGNDDVHYIHIRNTEAGCYIARIVRSGMDENAVDSHR
jgi:hypothetical protein